MTVSVYLCRHPLQTQITQQKVASDEFVYLLEPLEFFECLFPCCARKKQKVIINSYIKNRQSQWDLFYKSEASLHPLTLKVLLTLASQIKVSLNTVLAIKDVHGVFALVLLSGLIDLKPKLLSCDSRLNSL